MRRPAGVIVAAVVLGLMAMVGILGAAASVAVSFLVQNPAVAPMPGVRAILAVTSGMMLCFFAFCGWTVVGLFRMRRWARYTILGIGGVEFCFSALLCAMMILLRNAPLPLPPGTAASPVGVQTIFLGMAVFYGLLSLVGAWWLVYFNLAHVREAFAGMTPVPAVAEGAVATGSPQAETPAWRIVIVVWACLMLVSVPFIPVMLFLHMPLFLLGWVIHGTAAMAVLLALILVQLYLGVGLLRKWKAAWYVAMAWQVYAVACFVVLLSPSVWARLMAYDREAMGRWGFSVATPGTTMIIDPLPFMRVGMVLGVLVVVLLTMALVRRREDYLRA